MGRERIRRSARRRSSGELSAVAILDLMRAEEFTERLIEFQDRVSRRVRDAQGAGALRSGGEATVDAARVAGLGAADVSFGLDVIAEAPLEEFCDELAREVPIRVLSEGFGDRVFAPRGRDPEWRLVVDPIDGTRNLMFDLRSGFVLSAVARERGDATRISDVEVAVMSELPPTDRRSATVMGAIRGGGAWSRTRDLDTGSLGLARKLEASSDPRIENGFVVFFKFDREEREAIAAIETRFLELVASTHGIDSRLLFDDQYICSAGHLFLLLTRRYRFVADLRGIVGDRLGIANQTSKPYDVCCSLIAEEAGVLLTDATGAEFNLPLDLESRVSVVGYANSTVRAALEPLLARALTERLPSRSGGR